MRDFLGKLGKCWELRWSPRQESNLYLALRRRLFYPLNYGESRVRDIACKKRDRDGDVDSAQSIANARRIGGRNACRCAARVLGVSGNRKPDTRNRNQKSTTTKSSLPTSHSGHRQSAGMSAKRVPAGIPSSGSPSASL